MIIGRLIGVTWCCTVLAALPVRAEVTPDASLADAYRRAADYLQFRVPTWLTHHETWAAAWSDDGRRFAWRTVGPAGEYWRVGDAETGAVAQSGNQPDFTVPRQPEINLSPRGDAGIGLEQFNLWRVDNSGTRSALTTDGREERCYAAQYAFGVIDNWEREALHGPMRPARGVWSPDGRWFATWRYDHGHAQHQYYWRAVGDQGYGGRPEFVAQAAPYPGDEHNAFAELVLVDTDAGSVRVVAEIKFRTLVDPVAAGLLQWSADSRAVYYLDEGRGLREVTLKRLDLADDSITSLYQERSDTYLMLSGSRHPAIWSVLDGGRSLLWFSERDGWGNLYRIDLAGGKVRNAITRGAGVVRQLVRVDEKAGWVYFLANGREPGVDPYFRQFYRARLDGRRMQLLTPEPADHLVSLPIQGNMFLDVQSAGLGAAPKTVLRALDGGGVRATVAEMDFAPLQARGWRAPERIRVRDADDRYDVYASVFRPGNYDPARSYPVLDFIYGLASLAETPYTFPPGADHELGTYYWRAQSVAEVGFVVIMLDAPGTPMRGHEYARQSYGAGHVDATLRHHVAAIRQLAARDASLDLERVGIFGHSGGGFTSTRAMLFYPDFFKVAVSSAGSHDLVRMYGPEWGDRYIGPFESNKDVYARLCNAHYADRLRGRLLLAHGEADSEVTITMTQQLVHALIAANKDFDQLYIPNADHDMSNHPYFIRKRWDYFVTHLLGHAPPADFQIDP